MVDDETVTLGELIPSSLRESSQANRVPGTDRQYQMDFELGGSPDASFSKVLDRVLRDPAFRASLRVNPELIRVINGQLHLDGLTLNDAERIVSGIEAALARANEVRKADIAKEGINRERQAVEGRQESDRRAAFLDRMSRRHQR